MGEWQQGPYIFRMQNPTLEGLRRWANPNPGPTAEELLAEHEEMKKAYAELIRKRRAGEYVSDEDEYIADDDGNLNGEGNIITPRRKGRMVRSLTDTSASPAKRVASTTEGTHHGEVASGTLAKSNTMVTSTSKTPGSMGLKRKVLKARPDDPSDDASTAETSAVASDTTTNAARSTPAAPCTPAKVKTSAPGLSTTPNPTRTKTIAGRLPRTPNPTETRTAIQRSPGTPIRRRTKTAAQRSPKMSILTKAKTASSKRPKTTSLALPSPPPPASPSTPTRTQPRREVKVAKHYG